METPKPPESKPDTQIGKPLSDSEKQKLLDMSEISLILDTYDDIFSDFDPRPYAQRALSQDFLQETSRAASDKTSGGLELKFLIPAYLKDTNKEKIIKGRLLDHFRKHYEKKQKEVSDIRRAGFSKLLVGMFAVGASILIYPFAEANLLTVAAIVILEPFGWFFTYAGFEDVFKNWKIKKPELDFNEKMAKSTITFLPY